MGEKNLLFLKRINIYSDIPSSWKSYLDQKTKSRLYEKKKKKMII